MDKIRKYQIFSVFFTAIIGTLLHFTYNLSNGNQIIAIFSSVNESVWEHLKLLFFPMLITVITGLLYIKNEVSNFLCAKTIGIFTSLIFTIIFFFTYTGIVGKSIAIVDIASFYIAIILGEFTSYLLMVNKYKCNKQLFIIFLLILFICFVYFTFYTPQIGIFKDPVTGQYGIIK